MLTRFTQMVGKSVIRMALRTSRTRESSGVVTTGNPRPSVPCTNPPKTMTRANRASQPMVRVSMLRSGMMLAYCCEALAETRGRLGLDAEAT